MWTSTSLVCRKRWRCGLIHLKCVAGELTCDLHHHLPGVLWNLILSKPVSRGWGCASLVASGELCPHRCSRAVWHKRGCFQVWREEPAVHSCSLWRRGEPRAFAADQPRCWQSSSGLSFRHLFGWGELQQGTKGHPYCQQSQQRLPGKCDCPCWWRPPSVSRRLLHRGVIDWQLLARLSSLFLPRHLLMLSHFLLSSSTTARHPYNPGLSIFIGRHTRVAHPMPSTGLTKPSGQLLLSQDHVLTDTTGSTPSGRSVAVSVPRASNTQLCCVMKAGATELHEKRMCLLSVPYPLTLCYWNSGFLNNILIF